MAPNFWALFKALVWECTQRSNEEGQKGKPYGMFNFGSVPNVNEQVCCTQAEKSCFVSSSFG